MKITGTIQKHLLVWAVALSICLSLMVGCNASSTTPPVANGGELTTYQMEIDLLGAKHEASVDNQGRLKTSIEASSDDGKISLSIPEGTAVLDKGGKPLQTIQLTIDPSPPPPPEDAYIIGAVYDFGPEGANFNPQINLTLSYNLEELPDGVSESDIYIGLYDEGTGWGMGRYKRVDTENHRVTTHVNYSARYAVLAPIEHQTSDTPPIPADTVEVVYFHRAQRCASCIYAETGIRFTVETYFKDELASGKIILKVVNVADEENATIVNKYNAYTSSLFINTIRDGTDHIEEVTDIWFVLGNDEAFVEVVRNKIEKSLEESG